MDFPEIMLLVFVGSIKPFPQIYDHTLRRTEKTINQILHKDEFIECKPCQEF
jgi:hypothetical protein